MGITTLGQRGPESNGNKWVLYILQSSKTGASPSDNLDFYPGYIFLGEASNPSREMQSMYSTVLADCAVRNQSWQALCEPIEVIV